MTKIKTDKTNSYIEIEGEQEFVEKTYRDFKKFGASQEKREYTIARIGIMAILILVIIIGLSLFLTNTDTTWLSHLFSYKVLFGFIVGLFGLLFTNINFIGKKEQANKNLWFQYLIKYPLFIISSSLFVFSILNLNDKIGQSYLFYSFTIPINILVGLETYRVTILLENWLKEFI